jgi:hypothetical protein
MEKTPGFHPAKTRLGNTLAVILTVRIARRKDLRSFSASVRSKNSELAVLRQ